MAFECFRSESHPLGTTAAQRADIARTVHRYRLAVRSLATVIQTHWAEVSRAGSTCFAIESLFHPTAKRPSARYAMLDRWLGKMPSYLRRAAIEAAYGLVRSFLSNYSNWLDDTERERGSKPPRLGVSNVFPPLYGGNMIRLAPDWRSAEIKLLQADGRWAFSASLRIKGRLKRLLDHPHRSPTLIIRGEKASLSCPVKVRPPRVKHTQHRVCAVDVGINTAATAAIVDSTGTVIARTFLTCGRHNDQRDGLQAQIAQKQSASRGGPGKRLGRGFCRGLYRRLAGLNLDAARKLAFEVMAFARAHGATALVVEDLKGWRPAGRGGQRKRFHRFQHRYLVKYLTFRCEEWGLRLLSVYASGTSYYAYDGSGPVKRDKANAALATFSNGRRYNADLNGAQNIAARGLAILLGLKLHKEVPGVACKGSPGRTGKRSGRPTRIPLVLADIWAYAQMSAGHSVTAAGVSLDAPTTAHSA